MPGRLFEAYDRHRHAPSAGEGEFLWHEHAVWATSPHHPRSRFRIPLPLALYPWPPVPEMGMETWTRRTALAPLLWSATAPPRPSPSRGAVSVTVVRPHLPGPLALASATHAAFARRRHRLPAPQTVAGSKLSVGGWLSICFYDSQSKAAALSAKPATGFPNPTPGPISMKCLVVRHLRLVLPLSFAITFHESAARLCAPALRRHRLQSRPRQLLPLRTSSLLDSPSAVDTAAVRLAPSCSLMAKRWP